MLKKKLRLGMKKKCLKTNIPLNLECFFFKFNILYHVQLGDWVVSKIHDN